MTLTPIAVLAVLWAVPAAGPAQAAIPAAVPGQAVPVGGVAAADAGALVERIDARLASSPKLESWQARARATTSRMTADWTPRSTTVAEKIISVDGDLWSEEVLSAVETEEGRTRDVTRKLQDEARERAEKQKRSTPDERKAGQRSRGRRSLDMTRDEVLPFSPEKRTGYDFAIEGAAQLDGAPVVLLRSRSRARSQEKLEGLYYVDPETADVRRAELTLAKLPGPLKRMEMNVDFRLLPKGYLVMERAAMRIHVGLIVKNIRIEAVETYSDYLVRKGA